MTRDCPICDSMRYRELAMGVVTCESCGMVYTRSQEPVDYSHSIYARGRDGDGHCAVTAARIAGLYFDKSISILDVGCGNGELLEQLAKLGYTDLTGMDPSEECCAATRSRGFHSICLGLPFGIEEFDLVILSHVVEHLWAPREALRDIQCDMYIECPDAQRYAQHFFQPYLDFNTEHVNHFTLGHLGRVSTRPMTRGGSENINLPNGAMYPVIWGTFQASTMDKYVELSESKLAEISDRLERELAGEDSYILWGGGQFSHVLRTSPALRSRACLQVVDRNPALGDKAPTSGAPIVIASMIHGESIRRDISQLALSNRVITI